MGTDMKTFIIAEAGVNHNGDMNLAKRLIDVATEAGANAVKFQTFRATQLVSRHAPKAGYQIRTTDQTESQLEMIRKLELTETNHEALIAHTQARDITFLSTPFDVPSLHLLTRRFGLQTIKIPSGEITNTPFLLTIARAAQQVILSTGMSTLAEVEAALGVLAFGFVAPAAATPQRGDFEQTFASEAGQQALHDRVTLLHCTTEYPAPFDEVNLRAMDTLATAFGLPVGYSDHTPGIHVSLAAVARGARVIEKHFTDDTTRTGPDHGFSMDPNTWKDMVLRSRELEAALGDGYKKVEGNELQTAVLQQRCLRAKKQLNIGHIITENDFEALRPATVGAFKPYQLADVVGMKIIKNLNFGDELMFTGIQSQGNQYD